VGGSVTLRAHGLAGKDGNLISNQPLTIPAAIANPVHVLSTDDLTFNNPVTNNGSSVVDLVADDANPNPPGMSPTAILTIGASGTPIGAVRLFAVAPGQFSKPVTFTPAEKFGVWYQTFGTPIVGVNYKVLADPTLTTQASAAITLGAGTISDTGTLSGGSAPTGSIIFNLYGPNDATCTGTSVFTATIPVSGNAPYSSGSFTPLAAGTYRWVASYSGDASNNPATSPCNAPNESVVVNQATPTLTTQASAGVTLGNTVSDDGTLTGGVSPTGTITFALYGPNDATCSAAIAFTANIPVSGNGLYSSGPFTPTQLGTYRWVASYSGDSNNAPVVGACNAPNESVVVSQATPTLTTQASAPVMIGGSISDGGTLAGGANPTGTITFALYGPNDATCSAAVVFTANITVSGTGLYSSGPFTPTQVGTYRWVATYSGDANNAAVAGTCNAPNESVAVSQAAPTLTTQASAPVTLGNSISDTGTLSGGVTPTGSITFNLYGPNDAACSGAVAFTANIPVAGNGPYSSGPFTPVQPGTYRWVASYSGDANNSAVTSPCNAPNESVGVGVVTPTLTTQASAPVTIGGGISDSATLSGGASPTGSITFNLYGPNDALCSGAIVFTANVPVAGNAVYPSGSFTPAAAGTYRWVASYSG
ncbi:MAG TPA: hypothetical protein VN181_05565, partial [Thermoanaerobaculia bacterium]|nr:hypothetical protein [Thermoanaerobaculia bacterium]